MQSDSLEYNPVAGSDRFQNNAGHTLPARKSMNSVVAPNTHILSTDKLLFSENRALSASVIESYINTMSTEKEYGETAEQRESNFAQIKDWQNEDFMVSQKFQEWLSHFGKNISQYYEKPPSTHKSKKTESIGDKEEESLSCKAEYSLLSKWKISSGSPEVRLAYFRVIKNIMFREAMLKNVKLLTLQMESLYWRYAFVRIKATNANISVVVDAPPAILQARSAILSLQSEFSVALAHLRSLSVSLIENVVVWREICLRDTSVNKSTVCVMWKDENYLCKMLYDCDEVLNYNRGTPLSAVVATWIGFESFSTFLCPPSSLNNITTIPNSPQHGVINPEGLSHPYFVGQSQSTFSMDEPAFDFKKLYLNRIALFQSWMVDYKLNVNLQNQEKIKLERQASKFALGASPVPELAEIPVPEKIDEEVKVVEAPDVLMTTFDIVQLDDGNLTQINDDRPTVQRRGLISDNDEGEGAEVDGENVTSKDPDPLESFEPQRPPALIRSASISGRNSPKSVTPPRPLSRTLSRLTGSKDDQDARPLNNFSSALPTTEALNEESVSVSQVEGGKGSEMVDNLDAELNALTVDTSSTMHSPSRQTVNVVNPFDVESVTDEEWEALRDMCKGSWEPEAESYEDLSAVVEATAEAGEVNILKLSPSDEERIDLAAGAQGSVSGNCSRMTTGTSNLDPTPANETPPGPVPFWKDTTLLPAIVEAATGYLDVFPIIPLAPPLPYNLLVKCQELNVVLLKEYLMVQANLRVSSHTKELREELNTTVTKEVLEDIGAGNRQDDAVVAGRELRNRQQMAKNWSIEAAANPKHSLSAKLGTIPEAPPQSFAEDYNAQTTFLTGYYAQQELADNLHFANVVRNVLDSQQYEGEDWDLPISRPSSPPYAGTGTHSSMERSPVGSSSRPPSAPEADVSTVKQTTLIAAMPKESIPKNQFTERGPDGMLRIRPEMEGRRREANKYSKYWTGKSAIRIQASMRRSLAIRRVKHIKQQKIQFWAISRMQRYFRGMRARAHVLKMRRNLRIEALGLRKKASNKHVYAVQICSFFRNFLFVKNILKFNVSAFTLKFPRQVKIKMKEMVHRIYMAASFIQRRWRGILHRKLFAAMLRRRFRAAKLIQRFIRKRLILIERNVKSKKRKANEKRRSFSKLLLSDDIVVAAKAKQKSTVAAPLAIATSRKQKIVTKKLHDAELVRDTVVSMGADLSEEQPLFCGSEDLKLDLSYNPYANKDTFRTCRLIPVGKKGKLKTLAHSRTFMIENRTGSENSPSNSTLLSSESYLHVDAYVSPALNDPTRLPKKSKAILADELTARHKQTRSNKMLQSSSTGTLQLNNMLSSALTGEI